MDKHLLSILVCPLCKGALKLKKSNKELLCFSDGLAYPLKEGIPIMCVEQARRLSVAECDQLRYAWENNRSANKNKDG